jgi:basic membrane protein A and related proteins
VFQSAKAHGVLAFGTNRDQSEIAPETVLASAVISIPQAFFDVAKEVKEHRFVGRVVQEGLANGTVGFVFNPRLKDQVPPGVLERVAVAEQRIKSGELKVTP